MGNFKMKQDTLVSPRNYQGEAPIIGMSDDEARNIDEHDNAIPKKKEVVVKKGIPNISMDNNFTQTATGGTRFKKPSASKRTPEKLRPTKEEQPKTQSLNKKVYKPKPQDIDKKTTNK